MADCTSETKLSRNAERKQFKTPRLYKEAAKIIELVENKGVGLKNCLFKAKHTNRATLTALVCQVIQRRAVLEHVIAATGLDKETHVNPFLLRVVVSEQLFMKKTLTGLSKAVLVTKSKREALEKALENHGGEAEIEQKAAKGCLAIPRYGRVNLLQTTLEEVVFALESDNFVKIEYDPKISYNKYIELVKSLGVDQFLHDLHIENLLVFHPQTNFFKHSLYTSGKLLLQDKASCLPALFLNPPRDSFVLDACAAPGMKTTHLSALMNNTGEILAMDKDKHRASVMTNILEAAKVTNATVKVADFTAVNVNNKPYSMVDYILLDPSCSGSGIVKRSAMFDEDTKDERIGPLTTFQKTMLMKALSFPNVKRVVYSTCSIHEWENEEVVSRALKNIHNKFRLVNVNVQRDWPFANSQMENFPKARFKCIRTVTERDLTNGFFMAVFERINEEENVQEVPAEGVSVNGKNAEKAEKIKNITKTLESPKAKEKKGKVAKILPPAESDNTESDDVIEDSEKIDDDAESSGNEGDKKQSPAKKKAMKDSPKKKKNSLLPQDVAVALPSPAKNKKALANDAPQKKKIAFLPEDIAVESPSPVKRKTAAKDTPKKKKAARLSDVDVEEDSGTLGKLRKRKSVA